MECRLQYRLQAAQVALVGQLGVVEAAVELDSVLAVEPTAALRLMCRQAFSCCRK